MNKSKRTIGTGRKRLLAAGLSLAMLLSGSIGILPLRVGLLTGTASAAEVQQAEEAGNRKEDKVAGSSVKKEYDDNDPDAFYGSDGTIKPANRKYEHTPIGKFRVSNISPQVSSDMDYVDVWYSPYDDSRYLFLPATADRSKLTLELSFGGGTMTLNDIPVTSAQSTDIFSTADEFQIKVGNTEFGTLHVLQSDLKVMYLSTETGGTDYIDRHKGKAQTAKTLMLTETGAVSYSGAIEKFTSHGNSSWDYSKKKPYNIKLPEKANLYGLGKAKKWVLLSNYLDHSMLRNVITTEMSRQAGVDYTMDNTFVDLFCDGSYRGTYQLYEKIQIQKQRVNITDLEEATEALNAKELSEYGQSGEIDYVPGTYKYWNIPKNPTDITGGYLLQFQLYNRYKGKAESGFVTTRGQAVQIDGPEYASKAQVEYIRNFVQELEDAIYSDTGYNSKGKHYSDYIDVDSLILGYLIQEISQNVDATYTSFYLYKDSDTKGDGKLHYGPAWDFDLAFYNFSRGITAGVAGDPSQQVTHYSGRADELYAVYYPISGFDKDQEFGRTTLGVGWIMQLYTHDQNFVNRCSELYFERFDEQLRKLCDTSQEGGSGITKIGQQLSASAALNDAMWHMHGKSPYKVMGPYNGETYPDIVEFLRKRVELRRNFLRKEWLPHQEDLIAEKLPDELNGIDLTRYDPEGRRALDAAIEAGQDAVRAAESLEDAQAAYSAAVDSLSEIPRAELPGDFDESLNVDVRDAQMVLQYYAKSLAGLPVSANSTQLRNGDIDKNGRLDAIDALQILEIYTDELAKKPKTMPDNLNVSTLSVSSLKATWDTEPDCEYRVNCMPLDEDYEYADNIFYVHKSDGLCYITGLRENTEYSVTVEPVYPESDQGLKNVKPANAGGKTETVNVIYEYPYESGWTNCFAGDRASMLKHDPSLSAIAGSIPDPVTGTGIRRDEYGDYCCAMGLFYGVCNDRFLIELENGTQFTTKICDSKGYADDGQGKYHIFAKNGKCIVEFIYDEANMPASAALYGSWGYNNWSGLDLRTNIKSIKKIRYGEPVEY
ncbi:MAG: CotH kinase family protein [Oscillospiraceae bacterium]|nr:CotH kinase family protein [Oscillospiraceae bacterium]